jgi:hypothetical protein
MLGSQLKKLEGNRAMGLVLQTKVLWRLLVGHKPELYPIANMPDLRQAKNRKSAKGVYRN